MTWTAPLGDNERLGFPPLPGSHGLRVAAVCVLVAAATTAQAAETYAVTATTTLAVQARGALQQTWTAECVAEEASLDAVIAAGGKDLRFFEARDEVVAFSVDDQTQPITAPASGAYLYDNVFGAHVFARLTVRCGAAKVFDDAVVESVDVVTAPGLDPPFSVRRTDTLTTIPGDDLPGGVVLELVDLPVLARPRGSEVVVVRVSDDDGVELSSVELGAVDLGIEGRALVSPRFTSPASGLVTVRAEFLGSSSDSLVFRVGEGGDEGEGEGFEGEGEGGDGGSRFSSCASGGVPGVVGVAGVAFVVVVAGRRRRRAC